MAPSLWLIRANLDLKSFSNLHEVRPKYGLERQPRTIWTKRTLEFRFKACSEVCKLPTVEAFCVPVHVHGVLGPSNIILDGTPAVFFYDTHSDIIRFRIRVNGVCTGSVR